MSVELHVGAYPVVIFQDRYHGVYSGGEWIAIANADQHQDVALMLFTDDDEGPWSDDTAAMDFWWNEETKALPWLTVGRTPDAALAALLVRLKS